MGNDPAAAAVISARAVTKRFGRIVANHRVDFDVLSGEIHGLVGENGSGKTTLMSLLYGIHRPDEGQVLVDGNPVTFASSRDARSCGIGMIPQRPRLVPNLTVVENVALGSPEKGSHKRVLEDAGGSLQTLAARYGLHVKPEAVVRDLSVGECQRTEILKALYYHARILLMDEPTSVLTPPEVKRLSEVILRLVREEGVGVVFVTHKIHEIMAIADRITVLRGGRRILTAQRDEVTAQDIVRAMVGDRTLLGEQSAGGNALGGRVSGEPVLILRDVHAVAGADSDGLRGVTFEVAPGEIFGIAGVDGNGQQELELVAAGLLHPEEGSIVSGGEGRVGGSGRDDNSVAYIPSDRFRLGLAGECSVAENLLLRVTAQGGALRLAPYHVEIYRRQALRLIEEYGVHPPDIGLRAASLSGGNAQKVVLARELARNPRLVIAAQPTMGLDIATTAFVRSQIRKAAAGGAGVLLISSDLDELLALADRIGVLYRGTLVGVWAREGVNIEELGGAMAGVVGNASSG